MNNMRYGCKYDDYGLVNRETTPQNNQKTIRKKDIDTHCEKGKRNDMQQFGRRWRQPRNNTIWSRMTLETTKMGFTGKNVSLNKILLYWRSAGASLGQSLSHILSRHANWYCTLFRTFDSWPMSCVSTSMWYTTLQSRKHPTTSLKWGGKIDSYLRRILEWGPRLSASTRVEW